MPAADYTHSPTPEEIMEYLDGEGAVASRTAIEAHLANCGTCQALAVELRGVSEQASAWKADPAPESLRPPASSRPRVLPAGFPAWRPSRLAMGVVGAAAAVLIVIAAGSRASHGTRTVAQAIHENNAMVMSEPATPSIQGQTSRPPVQLPPAAGPSGTLGGMVGGLPTAPVSRLGILRGRGAQPVVRGEAATMAKKESGGAPRSPAVIRTATLRIVAKEFSGVRPAVEAAVSQAGGFIDQMTITGDTSTARALRGTLRVPGDRMSATLARLRQIGQVVEDTQGAQDVTDQIVDLDARLASARATEQRLTELLRNRTGKLSDVLEVERELARVRLDIERLDAEKTNTARRVIYATIDINIAERKAGLDAGPLSLATRIRVAAADGLESALESVAWTVLFLLRTGPTLILWSVVVAVVWLVLRRRVRFGIRD
jgi:Domain of unknown function (DUF4349)